MNDNIEKISIREYLKKTGVPRACFWNSSLDTIIEVDKVIAVNFQHGYSQGITKIIVNTFGKERVLNALETNKDYCHMGDTFYYQVYDHVKKIT